MNFISREGNTYFNYSEKIGYNFIIPIWKNK